MGLWVSGERGGDSNGRIALWDMESRRVAVSWDEVGMAISSLAVSRDGSKQGDPGYDARYDLDGDGAIEFDDFLIFVNAFHKG